MEDTNQPQAQPATIPQPVQPTSSKPKKPLVSWALVVLFLIGTVVSTVLFFASQKKLSNANKQKDTVQNSLNTSEQSLKKAEDKLKTAVFLPDNVSPQCNSSNNAQLKLAPVNTVPIAGYNVYIVNCLNDLTAGKNTNKIIAFKANADGSQTFEYGAGSGEPFCISGKILPTSAATEISKQTSIPICKTF